MEAFMKNLFRGAFNYRQSARIEYTYANSCKQAWLIICRRLAKKDGVDPRMVMGLFDGSRNNYEITVEMEVRENDAD
jgi:hypothetical protein